MTSSESRRIHRRLTLNSLSNVSRYGLSIVIAFFLTPYVVRTLGDSHYGFWVLLVSFIGYASILEMGVQPAVVKLVGQYNAVGDHQKLRELVSAAFVFFLGVGILAAILVMTLIPELVTRHVKDLADLPLNRVLFAMIATDTMVGYMNYLFTGILYGCQRYHLKNVIDAAGWLLNAGLVVIFIERYELVGLVGAKLAMDSCVMAASIIATRKAVPQFGLQLRGLRRESFSELMNFGGRVFLSSTTTRVATLAQPAIISAVLSSAATAFYAIPVKLIDYSRQIGWTLSASFMPMFSHLESRNERELLRNIYLDYSRYIFALLLPISIGLFAYGNSFIGVWIGPEYAEKGHVVFLLLVGAVTIESFQPLLWRFFIGVGELDVLVKVSAVVSILVVVASAIGVRFFGIAGVGLAVLAGAIVSQWLYALHACRYLKISVWQMFERVHARVLLSGGLMLLLALSLERWWGADNYALIAAGGVTSSLVYAGVLFPIALTKSERGILRSKIRAFFAKNMRLAQEK